MSDKENRSIGARNIDIDLEKNSGRIDLTNLTYKTQQDMKELFLRRVMKMESLLPEAGVPNIELPSGNLYRSLIKYDTENFSHPAVTLLNRMMFNVDPSKQGLQAFNFGGSSLLQADILENISSMADTPIQAGKRILTFDSETTGVMKDSQVRQFAYQIEEATADGKRIIIDPNTGLRAVDADDTSMVVASFRNSQMNLARASVSGQSMPLADFVASLEGRTNLEMGEGGVNFVTETKKMLNSMLNADHVAGHNVLFDVDMMGRTLESLDAFHKDSEAVNLLDQFYGKIREKGYLIDTQESMRSYLYDKASTKFSGDPDKASKFVSQLLGPETLASIGIGGSTAPVSVENIALNTNVFQLIEQEDQDLAKQMVSQLKKGSHIADTDVALQASMDRYRRSGQLDFRFDEGGAPIDRPLSEFEKFARNQVFKSGAINPTTNVASVQHISDSVFQYATSEAGIKRAKITTSGSALGLVDAGEGILSYSKSQEAFTYRRFGTQDSVAIDESVAKTNLTRTLNQARAQGEGVGSNIRVGTSSMNVTRNLADEQIISLGFNMIQSTKIDEAARATSIASGITNANLADTNTFIRSLGLTSEQFGEGRSFRAIMNSISGREEMVSPLRNPLEMSRETIDSYYLNAAKAGLPFNNINVVDRALSVGIAQSTFKIAESAPKAAYAQNASLLSEMGFSFFNMQDTARIGGVTSVGDIIPPSKVMMPFAQVFDIGTSTVGENVATSSLSVKAFGSLAGGSGDILSTDLNRFTLSYVSGSGETGQQAAARVNLVWGANGALSKQQSEEFASYAYQNANEFRDLLSQMDNLDAATDVSKVSASNELLTSGQKFLTGDSDQRTKMVTQLAEHIRDRGIVMGFAEGDAAEGIRQSYASRGMDITGNDVRAANTFMRIAHADKESGILVMSAVSDIAQDEAMQRTSAVAQRETAQAFQTYQTANEILNDSSNKRKAKRVIAGSRSASAEDVPVDLTKDVRRDFVTPMSDFYLGNKRSIGFAGLGLAAAGIGYYMHKKNKEKNVYEESMAAMPTEMGSPSPRRQMEPTPLTQSTRRDPLVTAGVVGNLDRNKTNHYRMGPKKYDHLYGG